MNFGENVMVLYREGFMWWGGPSRIGFRAVSFYNTNQLLQLFQA